MEDKRYQSREVTLYEVFDSHNDETIMHRSADKEEIDNLRDQLNDEHGQRVQNASTAAKGLRLDVADEVGTADEA